MVRVARYCEEMRESAMIEGPQASEMGTVRPDQSAEYGVVDRRSTQSVSQKSEVSSTFKRDKRVRGPRWTWTELGFVPISISKVEVQEVKAQPGRAGLRLMSCRLENPSPLLRRAGSDFRLPWILILGACKPKLPPWAIESSTSQPGFFNRNFYPEPRPNAHRAPTESTIWASVRSPSSSYLDMPLTYEVRFY